MKGAIVAVERNEKSALHLRATEVDGSSERRAPDRRFTYAGGARPLDGYTVKRGIGHGGFGEVYYATSDGGKEVALKLIRRNLDVELRGVQQCINLKHPNLLSIHDIRQDEQGDHWVVMEYVTDPSLEDALAEHPDGLPEQEALRWMHGLGAAVAYLHDHGIVHRDLKPGNIFCDEGIVKIGDYGLSKFISCSRRSGQTESVGTVHYMAPEVANGRYGKEIDVYAAGVMLYEMLTGHVPFEGESVGEVLMKHLTAKPDLDKLAEPYRSVVAKALEKDPEKRFGRMSEMLSALPPLPADSWHCTVPPRDVAAAAGNSASSSSTKPVALAQAVDDEPVLRAVRELWREARRIWRESDLSAPMKVGLVAIGIFSLLATAEVLLPLAVLLLISYGVYRAIRGLVRTHRHRRHARSVLHRQASSEPTAEAGNAGGGHVHGRLPAWHRTVHRPAWRYVPGSPRERVAELLGSMLGATLVAVTMCLVMVILIGFQSAFPSPEQAAWVVMMSVLGTWAVLIPSKLWEGGPGDSRLRRFVLLVVGLVVGMMAFGLSEVLMVHLSYHPKFPQPESYELPARFYAAHDGRPLLLAHMAVFGTLFFAVRWWLQAAPWRTTRLSLWAMFVSIVTAAAVAALWHFPQPWLVTVACAISVSVQLASPWVAASRRSPQVEA